MSQVSRIWFAEGKAFPRTRLYFHSGQSRFLVIDPLVTRMYYVLDRKPVFIMGLQKHYIVFGLKNGTLQLWLIYTVKIPGIPLP